MYEEGQGVSPNAAEAVFWFRKAVEDGSSWTSERLGNAYCDVWGVAQDISEAQRLYEKAFELGSTTAAAVLATLT
jgi:TPR repeat protein